MSRPLVRASSFARRCPSIAAALAVAAALFAGAAHADEPSHFIVCIGRDTTAVETHTRTQDRVVVDQVGRVPRVTRRSFTYDLVNGRVTRIEMVAQPVDPAFPRQTLQAAIDGDSLRVRSQNGETPAQVRAWAVPAGVTLINNATPWATYESQAMACAKTKDGRVALSMWFVGAGSANTLEMQRVGKDSLDWSSDRGDHFRARIDDSGRFLGVRPLSGPTQLTVHRVASLDLTVMAAGFAAREKAGAGLGVLSPRDTVRVANAGDATITIDYSRPAKRGRVVYGGIVPYDQLWRTGANAATVLQTDKPLAFRATVVPAGSYTLWTIPSASGWRLFFNTQTGQWGTEHDPKLDLPVIPMTLSKAPAVAERFTITIDAAPGGGVLHMDWDTTRVSAPFTVGR